MCNRHAEAIAGEAIELRISSTAHALLDAARHARMTITADLRVSEGDAAALLSYAPGTLKNLRNSHQGPEHYRIGGHGHRITYRLSDLAEWIESRRNRSAFNGT